MAYHACDRHVVHVTAMYTGLILHVQYTVIFLVMHANFVMTGCYDHIMRGGLHNDSEWV